MLWKHLPCSLLPSPSFLSLPCFLLFFIFSSYSIHWAISNQQILTRHLCSRYVKGKGNAEIQEGITFEQHFCSIIDRAWLPIVFGEWERWRERMTHVSAWETGCVMMTSVKTSSKIEADFGEDVECRYRHIELMWLKDTQVKVLNRQLEIWFWPWG